MFPGTTQKSVVLRHILAAPPLVRPVRENHREEFPTIRILPFNETEDSPCKTSDPTPEVLPDIRIRPFSEIAASPCKTSDIPAENLPEIRIRPFSEIASPPKTSADLPIKVLPKYQIFPSTERSASPCESQKSLPENFPSIKIRPFKEIAASPCSSDVEEEPIIVSEVSLFEATAPFTKPPESNPSKEPLAEVVKSQRKYCGRSYAPEYAKADARKPDSGNTTVQFEKIIVDQKHQVKPSPQPLSSPDFPEKYSPHIGLYYECPQCLQKYVSPVDVTEHLEYCDNNGGGEQCAPSPEEPETPPDVEVEIIDLAEDDEVEDDDDDSDPDFVPRKQNKSLEASKGESKLWFPCDFAGCKKQFSSKAGLSGHRRSHRDRRDVFKCPECSHQFSWKVQLKSHLIKRHPQIAQKTDLEKQRASVEMSENLSVAKRKSGEGRKSELHCSSCDMDFNDTHEYIAHDLQHRIDIEKNFVCKKCNKSFFRRAFLTEHEKTHEPQSIVES